MLSKILPTLVFVRFIGQQLSLRHDIQKPGIGMREPVSVLIDYSKAFDTINHRPILEKLVSLNFSNRTTKIIMSYLTNPHQYVQIVDQTTP